MERSELNSTAFKASTMPIKQRCQTIEVSCSLKNFIVSPQFCSVFRITSRTVSELWTRTRRTRSCCVLSAPLLSIKAPNVSTTSSKKFSRTSTTWRRISGRSSNKTWTRSNSWSSKPVNFNRRRCACSRTRLWLTTAWATSRVRSATNESHNWNLNTAHK